MGLFVLCNIFLVASNFSTYLLLFLGELMRRYIITDKDIIEAFQRWSSPELKNQKMHTSFIREAVCRAHPDKVILQYDVRQKLKNMASRGLVIEVRLSPNATAWMIIKGDSNGQN
ncbi:hypothetical protein AB184_05080 [Klebsiella oxytoca]|nr:hypothetical protein AB184_05080 [Klebsiella oxytoca]AKL21563.1 hypothetical protein AB181_05335 [Klebsiella oxytoca]APB43554.1 hypothetical protein AGF18_06305 [Klebsiella oxytoca]OQR49727.1 hypothetical protein BI322_12275 [Klebsiella oxytoca]